MKKQKKTPKIGGTHVDNPFQRARLNAGLSQEQAAEKLSCAPRTLQRYEAARLPLPAQHDRLLSV